MNNLPRFARELAKLLGEEAMQALCAAYGGIPLHVPKSLSAQSALPLEIGAGPAQLLVRAYGGLRIEPPKLVGLRIERAHAEIQAEHQRGASVTSLAVRHNRTVRQIRNIVAKA